MSFILKWSRAEFNWDSNTYRWMDRYKLKDCFADRSISNIVTPTWSGYIAPAYPYERMEYFYWRRDSVLDVILFDTFRRREPVRQIEVESDMSYAEYILRYQS